MKKIVITVILILCTAMVFSQEIVGNIVVREPNIKIEIDFYDNAINVDAILEIVKIHILSTQSKGLQTIDNELSDNLMEVIQNLNVESSDFTLTWGSVTDYCAIKYSFTYKEKEYFIIHILPEDRLWFFENLRSEK